MLALRRITQETLISYTRNARNDYSYVFVRIKPFIFLTAASGRIATNHLNAYNQGSLKLYKGGSEFKMAALEGNALAIRHRQTSMI